MDKDIEIVDAGQETLTSQEKVVLLFKYIRDLNALKQKIILRASDHPWFRPISWLPIDEENIHVYYRDKVEEELPDTTAVLLSVHKPEFSRCPEPDSILREWLFPGWDMYSREVNKRERIERTPVKKLGDDSAGDDDVIVELFTDNAARVRAYNSWITKREEWAEKQKKYAKTRAVFSELYTQYVDLERDSETLEMVVANGFVCDKNNSAIDHPVLTRRVKVRHDASTNTIFIEDLDVSSDMYTPVFQEAEDINLKFIGEMREDLQKNDYHPLDRNDTPEFLKVLIRRVSSSSYFSAEGKPAHWNDRFLMYMNPCYIVRQRVDGTLKAIEQIIENIEETGEIPAPICDIVSGGKIEVPDDSGEETLEEKLAAVGGESVDILLSKEANKEQLEIARRIEHYNAVLVQGPPGTGKTHTIANLMGHFLAQGKSVLVTSHTKKALSVLKEKIAPGLRNLCVSILDDSNLDMERSVDGITDYMSRYTYFQLKREMDDASAERKLVISDLADTRRKLFQIINKENDCIVFNGESISPSRAAAFVLDNAADLDYIPGEIRRYEPIPASFAELSDLYRSNEYISAQDECELSSDLPDPKSVLSPAAFDSSWTAKESAKQRLRDIEDQSAWSVDYSNSEITISTAFGTVSIPDADDDTVAQVQSYIASFGKIEEWMQYAAVDGKKGGSFKGLWGHLISQIQETCRFSEAHLAELFGKKIAFSVDPSESFVASLHLLRDKYAQKGKISKLDLLFNKSFEQVLSDVTINGKAIQNADDCDVVLHFLERESLRKQCAGCWDDLIAKHNMPRFFDLDMDNQEQIAANYIPLIERYTAWYKNEFAELTEQIARLGISTDVVFQKNALDSDIAGTAKILGAVDSTLPRICEICRLVNEIRSNANTIAQATEMLRSGDRAASALCKNLTAALDAGDVNSYANAYSVLESTYAKHSILQKREDLLKRIYPVAPQWADSIKNRVGIHGEPVVPSTIEDAWKWKQYAEIIDDIMAEPFGELQRRSIELSKKYREITAHYAEKKAWYYLLYRTEADIGLKQALIGWKQLIKKIGKGTGKNAPMYRAEARKKMAKCQEAVPGWIMPIGKALESLDPKHNKFDVVIIDEASQSDISSLAILYMGKRLIIVGDDKQVSPMAVGLEVSKVNALRDMYITGKIPNAVLYDPKTSIYDIAATTFQPLMLREHFRCVPEIIGFSNSLSYEHKIKPLRDDSNCSLKPAVVNYRVRDGVRDGKVNRREAETIVALMLACIAQPEYAGKTFGVISLLGDEQVKELQQLIFKMIDPVECTKRRILCGNASNFQGDERDVIFLSIVDSPSEDGGPLKMQNFGQDDAFRKRYNVAASRAKDQLWVVDSLDAAVDLKPGDIRKILIDYSLNPAAADAAIEEAEEHAESAFEAAVAKALIVRGYHLVQQWKVGTYRLDMVAVCGDKKVAIECDGERYHSGDAKIREDMERQTILERLGWTFIRIRGSEYFRNPESALSRVVGELHALGIDPEDREVVSEESRETELLTRVKAKAAEILREREAENPNENETAPAAGYLLSKLPSAVSIGTAPPDSVTGETPSPPRSTLRRKQSPPKAVPAIEKPEQTSLFSLSEASRPVPTEVHSPIFVPQSSTERAPRGNTSTIDTSRKPNTQAKSTPLSSGSFEQQSFDVKASASPKDLVIEFLQSKAVEFVDNRSEKGALWIIGGSELQSIVEECRSKYSVIFSFAERGGKATGKRPGWWAK